MLEADIGASLLERERRGTVLADAGEDAVDF
jgi:DNA-binding transcriptional LysR family regulator